MECELGGLIEGSERRVGYYYDDLSPYRQARRYEPTGTSRSAGPTFPIITAGFTLLSLGVSLGVLFTCYQWQQSDDKKFAGSLEGKCFATAAGARGVVDTVIGKDVKLAFPSGVSETYAFAKLQEIPCEKASEQATNPTAY